MAHYRKRSAKVRRILLRRRIICGVCLVALILGIFFITRSCKGDRPNISGGENSGSSSDISNSSGEPYVISSAKIGSTGDILIHDSVLWTVEDKGYDFSGIFATAKPY